MLPTHSTLEMTLAILGNVAPVFATDIEVAVITTAEVILAADEATEIANTLNLLAGIYRDAARELPPKMAATLSQMADAIGIALDRVGALDDDGDAITRAKLHALGNLYAYPTI